MFDLRFMITNRSDDTTFDDLQIDCTLLTPPPIACTIIRERGSLCFTSLHTPICLGNLHPKESLEVALQFDQSECLVSSETLATTLTFGDINTLSPVDVQKEFPFLIKSL